MISHTLVSVLLEQPVSRSLPGDRLVSDCKAVCAVLGFAGLFTAEIGFADVPKAHNVNADRAIAGAS